ncbi:MAG: hypothetical protein IKO41_06125 [Lachnospiraceae bacterium]|nr:hypothetical protein [Desulfovibrio sp.]MBR4605787.1 hypothetical protein [Lachnospiraceae bacterium]
MQGELELGIYAYNEHPDLTEVPLKDYIIIRGNWAQEEINHFLKNKDFDFTRQMFRIESHHNDEEMSHDFRYNFRLISQYKNQMAEILGATLPFGYVATICDEFEINSKKLLALAFCFKYRRYLTGAEERMLYRAFPFDETDKKYLSRRRSCRIWPMDMVHYKTKEERGEFDDPKVSYTPQDNDFLYQ